MLTFTNIVCWANTGTNIFKVMAAAIVVTGTLALVVNAVAP